MSNLHTTVKEQLHAAQIVHDLLLSLNPLFIAIFIFGVVVGVFFFSGLFRFFNRFLDKVMPFRIVYISDLGEKTELYRWGKSYYSRQKYQTQINDLKQRRLKA
ncbi:hypothetical protein [Acinetobacter sp. ANC 4641]|uniref:hypothetical protein n=1 Tax=Acinetobacter sp. ANC 4641 TaxID=2529847 RepID=UPI00103CD957|nr:hypothetical protein [Acinetobacter sp. ANC 4641]TCB05661.1 hypothetical protein E0H78_13765 [Acinetobacter sp. ANC 4641]